RLAEAKKELGNHQYKLKQYWKAIPFYTEAINLCPENPSYYGNRAACYVMLGMFKAAQEDARKSVQLNNKFVKGWSRLVKCCLATGDFAEVDKALARLKELEPNNDSLASEAQNLQTARGFEEEALKAYEKKDYRKVVYCLDRAMDSCTDCVRFKSLKSQCLARLGRTKEAQLLANEILGVDKQNADAIYVRGMCLYYEDNLDKAIQHFQHVLKLAPDHGLCMEIYKKAKALKQKKEEGNDAFNKGQNQEAYKLYTTALSIDPENVSTNAKLYFNRATVSSKLGKLSEAISDCTLALKLDPDYLKALLRRAKCNMDLGQYKEAVQDYEKALRMDKSPDIKTKLNEAKFELKKSQRKDYYKILGIDKNASAEDVKKAYRKRALVYHPDRHVNASESEKKEQEIKFKEVGEAYGILSDPQKRMRYDNGQDLEDGLGMSSGIVS
ncbi:hypothetical protein AAG570_001678, partial [Ranatra chinensis]